MEVKLEIPFQQLLTWVKTLTPSQKARLRKELEESAIPTEEDNFIDYLIKGPVYSNEDVAIIEENRKSIAAWRKND